MANTFKISITIDTDEADGESLKAKILDGSFSLDQAVADAGPEMPIFIGFQAAS